MEKKNNTLLTWEKALKTIEKVTQKTDFISQKNSTGVSFFEGKQRLCKIVKTKKNLKLEINLELSNTMIKKLNDSNGILEKISPQQAKEKKLGTMKYCFKDTTDNLVKEIVIDMLKGYYKNFEYIETNTTKKETNK